MKKSIKHLSIIILTLIISNFVSAQLVRTNLSLTNPERVTRIEKKKVKSIYIENMQNVYFTKGDKFKLEIESDKKTIQNISTDLNSGHLRIYVPRGYKTASSNIYITYAENDLELKVNGISILEFADKFDFRRLYINIDGIAETIFKANADEIELLANNLREINCDFESKTFKFEGENIKEADFKGQAEKATFMYKKINDLDAKEYKIGELSLETLRSGSQKFDVTGEAKVDAIYCDSLSFTGNPNIIGEKDETCEFTKD
ncbi:MAG: DUF2807 domain-containing protein [Flavobacteriales bacterium]|nr:DUF2807 domain-containing protein [Flavobacteriales bacterium]